MHRWVCLSVTLITVSFGARTSTARAGVIAMPPPGPARVANADAVIVGRVEGIEPKDVMVGSVSYRIAVVKISQELRGIKDKKTLRIGFIPLPVPEGKDKGPFVIRSGGHDVQLQAGQDGLFLLTKRAKEDFYVIGGQIGYFIGKEKNSNFEKEVELVKALAKVLDNPQAALKAKDASERLLAASLLIEKYRSWRNPGQPKQEPIDAEESKLILQAVADAEWTAQIDFNTLRPSPGQLFQQLGISAKDGFTPPEGKYQAAVQAWLREYASKYRIQRFIAEGAK